MVPANFNLVAQTFAEQLPVCLVGGTGAVMLALALLRVSARQNPGARFRVWFSTLLAIAALLMLGGFRFHPGTSGTAAAQAGGHAWFELPASWAVYLFAGWVTISCLALMRVGAGLWQVYRLRKDCVEIDVGALDPSLQDCLHAHRKRRVSLCVSERVSVPTVIGFIRPVVVVPSWSLTELSVAELKQVLLHEVAHLQRWDDWTNLAQKVLRALLFFHPLAWWVESRLTLEREMACDDAVLQHTGNPNAYARCLASLAEKSFARRGVALAQAVVSRMRQTSLRVSRILRLRQPVATHAWTAVVPIVVLFSFATIVLSHGPKLVQFEDGAAPAMLSRTSAFPVVPGSKEIGAHVASGGSVSTEREHREGNSAVVKKAAMAERMQRADIVHPGAGQDIPQKSAEVTQARYTREARYVQRPNLVRAKSSDIVDENATLGHAVLVVMQTEQQGASGVTMWQVTVWRVTFSPESNPVRREITPKKV